MSAETASSIKTVEIYVPLLNEGTDVIRPTTGRVMTPEVVEVQAARDYDSATEEWQFPPGSKVKCVPEVRDGRRLLVARERVS